MLPWGSMRACPTCRAAAEGHQTNPFAPFCSKRCKLIDLGDWIDERHRIPEGAPPVPMPKPKTNGSQP